jgi:hypothetical protein
MPAVHVRQGVWDDLVVASQKQRRKPETLANQAVQDFLERTADAELVSHSGRAARRAPHRAANTEEFIRRYRRKT